MKRRLFVLMAFVLVPTPARAYQPAELLFTFQDAAITESSGVAMSSYSDRVLFTHNDSGDDARFYAVGPAGQTLATIDVVPPIVAADWEDMARAPGRDGKPALYFADMGDNSRARPFVTVFEVPEPVIDPDATGATLMVTPTHAYNLVYPTPRHDAESLMVTPGGDIVIVNKTGAASSVFLAEDPQDFVPNLMTRVATIDFAALGATDVFTTGGDIAPDGSKVIVRTYDEAFEWEIADSNLAAAFGAAPLRVELPVTQQGEAICYTRDGGSLVITSEGFEGPVHILRG